MLGEPKCFVHKLIKSSKLTFLGFDNISFSHNNDSVSTIICRVVFLQQFSVWIVQCTIQTENASNCIDLPIFAKKMRQILNLEVGRLPNLELLVFLPTIFNYDRWMLHNVSEICEIAQREI